MLSEPQTKTKLSPVMGVIDGTGNQLYKSHGQTWLIGLGYNTRIIDHIQYRINKIKQNMILIAGPPGQGKSYFALRLAQTFDKRFDPKLQVVFEPSEMMHLIGADSPLKRGQFIIIDEAQYLAGARSWYETVQRELMNSLEAIRSKGLCIVVVALHLELLDKVLRRFVLSEMMWMIDRGMASVYNITFPPFAKEPFHPKEGVLALQLPDYEKCRCPNCLVCIWRRTCQTDRAVYERMKEYFLNKTNAQSQKKVDAQEQKKNKLDLEFLLQYVAADKDKLEYLKSGTVDPVVVQAILKDHHFDVSDAQTSKLIRLGKYKYRGQNIFKRTKNGENN